MQLTIIIIDYIHFLAVLMELSRDFSFEISSGLNDSCSRNQYTNLLPYCTSLHNLSLPEVFSVSRIILAITMPRLRAGYELINRTDNKIETLFPW